MQERPKEPAGGAAGPSPPPEPGTGEELDLLVERIDTEGVLKEGFTGQEM